MTDLTVGQIRRRLNVLPGKAVILLATGHWSKRLNRYDPFIARREVAMLIVLSGLTDYRIVAADGSKDKIWVQHIVADLAAIHLIRAKDDTRDSIRAAKKHKRELLRHAIDRQKVITDHHPTWVNFRRQFGLAWMLLTT